ncbi:vomeronasal type-2 receptor 1-like [Rhinatrema bivittatum]|uniref:vomeronasal type-2 receptor 1-like n=1 Tax=Rhinatrema bivittatum TaxID=194408 RepID=UPI0011296274|nr:vomeronasal type-2 receptor 1-like [Rhinatrema bivittatum]
MDRQCSVLIPTVANAHNNSDTPSEEAAERVHVVFPDCFVNEGKEMSPFDWLNLLLLAINMGKASVPGYKLELQKMSPFTMDGDFVLGVIALAHSRVVYPILDFRDPPKPAHCEGFQIRYYRDILAIMFAIEEINQNQQLLPNHTLGFQILDSCFSEVVALQDTLLLLSGGNQTLPNYNCEAEMALAGIIGEIYSSVSEVMARILGVYRIPQISISAQHPMLSDKLQFPSFLRTFPAATLLPRAMAQMLHHFNWTWVGILFSNADITSLQSQKIRQEVVENGGCVAFLEKIDDRYPRERLVKVAEVIHQSSARVIVCICFEVHLKPILELLSLWNVTAKVWIFSTSFFIIPYFFTRESWRLLNGSLVFIGSTSVIPHFTNFLYNIRPSAHPWSIFTKLFWEKAFGCQWEGQNLTHVVTGKDIIPCTGEEDLKTLDLAIFQLNDLSGTYHAYLAVYAYAHALHNMISAGPMEDHFGIDTNIHNIKPWQLEKKDQMTQILLDTGRTTFLPDWSKYKVTISKSSLSGHLEDSKDQQQKLSSLLISPLSKRIPMHEHSSKCILTTHPSNHGQLSFTMLDSIWFVSELACLVLFNRVFTLPHQIHIQTYGVAMGTAMVPDIMILKVLHYLKVVRFTTESKEEVYFDENGDVPAVFDIMNIQIHPDDTDEVIKVGRYDAREAPGDEIILNITAILWNQNNQTPRSVCSESCPVGYRKSARMGQPSCCFDCVPCSAGEIANETDITECWKCPEDQWPNENRDKCLPKTIEFLSYQEPLGAALVSVAVILSLASILILFIFYLFQDTPIVRANNRGLSYLLLCTLSLCFLCSLTFVGFPMKLTCMIRQPAFGLIFTISVSCILAKTVTVIIAFKAVNPHNQLRKWIGPKIPNLIIVFCSLIQLVICTYWISSHPSFPEYNRRSESGKIIVECNDGLTILFYCMLGYMGFLAIISFIVAFLARTLPDSFNEAKFITFSMLVFVSVWLSFIPAYLSTQGKYMVAVEIFTILSSGAGLLFLIFFPKCYIILLQPEMNTKGHLVGKKSNMETKLK